jgi:predicted DNA-binding WGR domain protein/ankyrin repeat protein
LDWRTDQQKTLPLNVPFDSQFTSRFKDKPKKLNKKPPQISAELEDLFMKEVTEEMAEEEPSYFTLPIIYMYENGYKRDDILLAVCAGADINLIDPASKQNLIMKAVLQNDEELIYEMFKVSEIDPKVVDSNGKSPIHLVINSHKNGSFENEKLLRFLAQYYDINQRDNYKFGLPIHYAVLQDSQKLANTLYSLGVPQYEIPFGVRRAPTSLISFTEFPDEEPNFEEDADEYIQENEKIAKSKVLKAEIIVPVDEHCQMPNSILVIHPVLGVYDTYMVLTDIKKGEFGGNTFYKMQLLYEYNREVFFLYTRYGRVGDRGQQQMTVFGTKEEAEKEFRVVFKQKSGNEWENKDNFERKEKRYKIVKLDVSDSKTEDLMNPN